MSNKEVLGAMAIDLKRVAAAIQRNSDNVAQRFSEEAIVRKQETDKSSLPPYIQQVLEDAEISLKMQDRQKKAEDCLMYSTLIQNFVIYR